MKTSMGKAVTLILLFMMFALVTTGHAQQASPESEPVKPSLGGSPVIPPGGSAAASKVVLKVGDEQFTQSDLDFLFGNLNPQTLATQGRRPIGEQYALMLLLSQQAVRDHLDSTPAFRRQLELQRHQMLAQTEYQRLFGQITISPEDVNQYYSTHPAEFEEAQVRQVVVRKKPQGAKEGAPGLAPQDARARVDSIRKAFAAGADLKQVAQQFSAPNDVMIDTEPRTIRRGQLLASLDKVAFELKDGDISEPVDTPQAFVLLQVLGRQRAELKQVSAGIENKLRQQRVEAVVAELKKKTTVWLDQDYFKPPQAPLTLTTVPSRPEPAPNR